MPETTWSVWLPVIGADYSCDVPEPYRSHTADETEARAWKAVVKLRNSTMFCTHGRYNSGVRARPASSPQCEVYKLGADSAIAQHSTACLPGSCHGAGMWGPAALSNGSHVCRRVCARAQLAAESPAARHLMLQACKWDAWHDAPPLQRVAPLLLQESQPPAPLTMRVVPAQITDCHTLTAGEAAD